MKKFLFSILLIVSFTTLKAQSYISLNNDESKPLFTIISSTHEETVIEYNFQGFYVKDIETSQGIKKSVTMKGASPLLVAGEPDLCRYSRSLIIPDMADMQVKVLSVDYLDFQNMEIIPSKGNLTRDIDPANVPYTWGRTYTQNDVFPGTYASLSEPYILRDYRGITLNVMPFRYNHQDHSLRVVKTIRIKVYKESDNSTNSPFVRTKSLSKVDENFDQLYDKHFINYSQAKYTPITERGRILVISKPEYVSAMAPYVQWKNRIGYPTEIVSTAVTGTTSTAIKTYVTNYYNTKGLTFLLFVGDGGSGQIPPITSGVSGPSDNAYAYITGNDHYPEFYVGRFSAESVADVDVQVLRTLTYEQNPNTSNNWMNRVLGIASSQGAGDDNEYDYEHIRNLQTQLFNYEYVVKYELFDGSQGGLDAPGNPTASNVSNIVNDGVGLILYTGHGSQTSFVTTGFSNSDISNLTNTTKWPFILSVACVNGDFSSGTCFAEAWLRARTGTTPKGAIATIMSTINQSWNPPMEGHDEMVNVLCETSPGNIKHTFGGIVMSGCMKMNDSYGTGGYDMTDTWTVFGDPSLVIRTDTPKTMTVSHLQAIPIGSSQLVVNCNKNGAYITVTLNDSIIGTGIVSGGTATINFTPLSYIDTLFVTATKYNYIPYMGEVSVVPASGPYVVYNSASINDAGGNNNGKADFGENILLNLSLSNVGVANASNVVATISTTNSSVSITDATENYGTINAGSVKNMNDAYSVAINNDIIDQTNVVFSLNATNGSDSWNSSFGIVLNSPVLNIGNIVIDDAAGNNNGKLDPGETVTIHIQSLNIGHATYPSATGTLTSNSSTLSIVNGFASIGNLNPNIPVNATFTVTVDVSATIGSSATFTYVLGTGFYQVQKSFSLKIGIVDENFESGDLTQYSWATSGNKPWFVTTNNPYEGTYCSQSGAISNNQTSIMSIAWDVAFNDSISFYRKVSCEYGSQYGQQWDWLDFSIDGASKAWWDGEKSWARVAYPVNAGQHTFKWKYEKDYTSSAGSDAAWIDYIVLPPLATPAGCQNISFNFGIYPNPASETLYIDVNLASQDNVKIELLDNSGRLIDILFNGNMTAGINRNIVDVSNLSGGAYFIRVVTSEGSLTRMIMTSGK